MTRIAGVCGIRTDGAGSIDRLLMEMRDRGFKTADVTLPRAHAWDARWHAKRDGKIVAQATVDGDVIVCHSYGSLRTYWAHWRRNYKAIMCIAPAMGKDLEWRHPERVHCYYSEDDWAIKIGSWLLFHPFGAAGNDGFTQDGVHNYKIPGAGHNDFFVGARMQWIADHIARLADPDFKPKPAYSRMGEKGFV